MQRIAHEYKNLSRIFVLIETLYTYVSDTEYMFDDVLWLDDCFKDVCQILEERLLVFNKPLLKKFELPRIPVKNCDTGREITVCLSGGKDSAAVAYYYKKKGYKVHLYHAAGVNKAYGDEKKAAHEIAKYLGCDLFVDNIALVGTQKYIEHPLKNYIIANGAIHYAMAKGYAPRIAFGNFNQSHLDDNAFEVCGGDCIEMWDAYVKIIHRVLPEFELEIPFGTNADTFNLLTEDWELFSRAVSCMSPFRFREFWRRRSEKLYNVSIFNNRCGCCWKCCMESMWLMDFDKVDFSPAYYSHCWDILERTVYKETGHCAESTQAVWDYYMFYPIEKSKMKDYILAKEIKRGFH